MNLNEKEQVERVTQKEIYICSDCGEEFENYDECDSHTSICRGIPPILDENRWFCNECDSYYEDEDEAKGCCEVED